MGRPSLCPLKRQMEWRHERNTTFLSRFAKQNLKNFFKSRPALIFATDVCLGKKSSHLETVQIKHHEPKGRVRSLTPSRLSQSSGCGEPGGGSPNTEAQLLAQEPVTGALGLPHFGPYQSKGRLLTKGDVTIISKVLGVKQKGAHLKLPLLTSRWLPLFHTALGSLGRRFCHTFQLQMQLPHIYQHRATP